MAKEVIIPWIPDYFTIALYPMSGAYVAHELQSNIWCRAPILLDALKNLSKKLIDIQLALDKATKNGRKVKRTPEKAASQKSFEIARKTGIILRNVVLEP
jgi:hypothetical protein